MNEKNRPESCPENSCANSHMNDISYEITNNTVDYAGLESSNLDWCSMKAVSESGSTWYEDNTSDCYSGWESSLGV